MGYVCNNNFQDNGFVQGNINIEDFKKKIEKKKPLVAILPDYHPVESLQLISELNVPIWVYPLHKKLELEHFEEKDVWIGFPHRKDDQKLGRDYTLKWFLNNVSHKKWWLGLWDDVKIDYLRFFDGLDTTMFYFLAMKQGNIWTSWGRRKKSKSKTGTEIINESFVNFKDYLSRKGFIIKYPEEGVT